MKKKKNKAKYNHVTMKEVLSTFVSDWSDSWLKR